MRSTALQGDGTANVTNASSVPIAANSSRAKVILCNNDAALVISLMYQENFGAPVAVAGRGIRLAPGQVFVEDDFTGSIAAITTAAGPAVLSWVEY